MVLHDTEHLGVEREILKHCFTVFLGNLSTPQEKTCQLILGTDILYMKQTFTVGFFFLIHFFLYFSVLPCQTVTRLAQSAAGPVSRSACHVPTQLPCWRTAAASPTAAPDSTVRTPSATVNYITDSLTFKAACGAAVLARLLDGSSRLWTVSVYESWNMTLWILKLKFLKKKKKSSRNDVAIHCFCFHNVETRRCIDCLHGF